MWCTFSSVFIPKNWSPILFCFGFLWPLLSAWPMPISVGGSLQSTLSHPGAGMQFVADILCLCSQCFPPSSCLPLCCFPACRWLMRNQHPNKTGVHALKWWNKLGHIGTLGFAMGYIDSSELVTYSFYLVVSQLLNHFTKPRELNVMNYFK